MGNPFGRQVLTPNNLSVSNDDLHEPLDTAVTGLNSPPPPKHAAPKKSLVKKKLAGAAAQADALGKSK